jgi:hypothetical protein
MQFNPNKAYIKREKVCKREAGGCLEKLAVFYGTAFPS